MLECGPNPDPRRWFFVEIMYISAKIFYISIAYYVEFLLKFKFGLYFIHFHKYDLFSVYKNLNCCTVVFTVIHFFYLHSPKFTLYKRALQLFI